MAIGRATTPPEVNCPHPLHLEPSLVRQSKRAAARACLPAGQSMGRRDFRRAPSRMDAWLCPMASAAHGALFLEQAASALAKGSRAS